MATEPQNEWEPNWAFQLLEKFRMLPVRRPTPNLFSVGGRGYYENPTSDLLAFFLRPDSGHDLGSLFLEALFESLRNKPGSHIGICEFPTLDQVSVEREVATDSGNRIDLLLQGRNWAMVIENKIYHGQINPFDDYESYVRKNRGAETLILVVLSPKAPPEETNWTQLSYKELFERVQKELNERFPDPMVSKWVLFAHEFTTHLLEILYPTAMTEQQRSWIEDNFSEVERLKSLSATYAQDMEERIGRILSDSTGNDEPIVRNLNWRTEWAIGARLPEWGELELVWFRTGDHLGEIRLSIFTRNSEAAWAERFGKLDRNFPMRQRRDHDGLPLFEVKDPCRNTTHSLEVLGKIAKAIDQMF